MILRKSKLTSVFWVVLLLISCTGIYFVSTGIAGYINMSGNLLVIVGAFLGVVLVTFLFSLLSKIAERLGSDDSKDIGLILEAALVFMVAVFGFLLRFVYIIMFSDQVPVGNIFHSAVNGSLVIDTESAGAGVIWGYVVKGIVSLVGNNIQAGMFVQTGIQLLTMFFIYMTMRVLMGKIPGFVGIMCYFFLPVNIMSVIDFNEDKLVSLIFMIALYSLSVVCKKSFNGILYGFKGAVLIVLAGVMSGFTAYLDSVGLGLILISLIMFAIYSKSDSRNALSKSGMQFLIYVASMGGAFFFIFWLMTNLGGSSIQILCSNYFNRISNVKLNYSFASLYSDKAGNIYSIIPIVLGSVWLFRLPKIDRDHGMYISFLPLIIMVFSFLSITSLSCEDLLLISWCILAGCGFSSLGKNSLQYLEVEKERKEQEKQQRIEEMELRKKQLAEKKEKEKERKKVTENRKSIFDKGDDSKEVTTKEDDDLAELEASLDFLHEDRNTNDDDELDTDNSDEEINVSENEVSENEISEEQIEEISDIAVNDNEITDSDASKIEIVTEDGFVIEKAISDQDTNEDKKRMVDGYYVDDENEDVKGEDDMFNNSNHGIKNDHAVAAASLPTGQNSRGSGAAVSLPVGKSANPMGPSAIAGPKALPTGGNSGIPMLLPSGKNNDVALPLNNEPDTKEPELDFLKDTSEENTDNAKKITMADILNDDTSEDSEELNEPVVGTGSSVVVDIFKSSVPENVTGTDGTEKQPVSEEVQSYAEAETQSVAEEVQSYAEAETLSVPEEVFLDELTEAQPDNEVETVITSKPTSAPRTMQPSMMPEAPAADENAVKTTPAVPPEAPHEIPSVPIVKYGRRMDYKTAVVTSRSSNSSILSKAEPMKPQTISVSPAPEKKVSAPIHNPLPTPKKHVARELDFDVTPGEADMHFDLVDLRGRDYFDIN